MDIVSLEILGITLHHKGRLQSQECGEQGKSPEKLFEAFDSLAWGLPGLDSYMSSFCSSQLGHMLSLAIEWVLIKTTSNTGLVPWGITMNIVPKIITCALSNK